ncbi:unnamed protein product, partial [Effrenium voratum]
MLPPPLPKKKKLPPVPVMAPPPSVAEADDDDDDDGDNLRLPSVPVPEGPVLGCQGPPPESSSSSVPREAPEEDLEPGGSFVLDEGEEVEDLAAEDCALPLPPEKVDFAAADL